MSFNKFCNICFIKENIIKLCGEESEPILNILISFTSCPDIVNSIIYLCINCCNKLEEYDNFREMCLTNFVRFRYLYNEHKKQLEIRNAPDIEIKLKAFVDVNVERPSGTPLIENYEAAQALRNDTTCNVDINYKQESDGEVTKIDLDELLNQNDLSHAEYISLENDIQIYHEKYGIYSSNEIQENNTIIALGNDESNPDRLEESQNQLVYDTVVKSSPCHESLDDDNSDVSFNPEECVTNDSTDEEDELNPDRSEESQDQLVCDTVTNASPCHDSVDDDNSDVSFNPKECVTDDSTDEGFTDSENRTMTSDTVCNVCDESFPCDKCRHTTFTDTVNIHKRLHSDKRPYTCEECSLIFKYRCHLKTHKLKHTGERPYKCDECGAIFSQRSHLKIHKRVHTGEKPYKCDECGVAFSVRSSLLRHKLIHTGEKPYKCDECDAKFSDRNSLKRHTRIHTGEELYKCDECSAKFSDRRSLKAHKYIHTGEKPYKCDECSMEFKVRSKLNRHKLIHTGEKPYKCDGCSAKFSDPSNLKKHKRRHTGEKPYKCNECSTKFSDRRSLKAHKHIHTGEKPYKCDECSAKFSYPSSLKAHKRVHTGEKPYKCVECGLGFIHLSYLNIHKRKHINQKL